MKHVLLTYGNYKETVTAKMILDKNMKAMVFSTDGETYIVDITPQGYILAPYFYILTPDYVLRSSIDLINENCFTFFKKARGRRYPAETITDAGYANDLALLQNTFV